MAWYLPQDQCTDMRRTFIELDRSHKGVVMISDLKDLLVDRCGVPEEECAALLVELSCLDIVQNGELQYSGLQAVMLSTKFEVHDGLAREAFRRLDGQYCGCGSQDKTWFQLVLPPCEMVNASADFGARVR